MILFSESAVSTVCTVSTVSRVSTVFTSFTSASLGQLSSIFYLLILRPCNRIDCKFAPANTGALRSVSETVRVTVFVVAMGFRNSLSVGL